MRPAAWLTATAHTYMVQVTASEGQPAKQNGRMLVDAAAGAIAGCIARFLTGPLDVIKIRFQVQLEPIASSGVKASAEAAKSKYTGFAQAFGTILKEEGVQARLRPSSAWAHIRLRARST